MARLDFRIPRDRAIIMQNVAVAGGGFSAEYQTVYDSFTTKPSDAVAVAQNTMVAALVAAGVWVKLDIFYLFAQESNGDGEALKNWLNPGTFDATLVNAPIFVSLEGFTGDGATQEIETGFNLTSDSVKYTLDASSFGTYIRTNVSDNGGDIAADAAADSFLISRSGSDTTIGRINAANSLSVANTDSRGFYVVNRNDSAGHQIWKNKVKINDAPLASTALPNDTVVFLSKGGTAYTTRQNAGGYVGANLTQTNIENFTDAIEVYMDSNGKGVIP
jgi:hypothetical protein